MLTLSTANAIIDHALSQAGAKGLKPLAVAVFDAGGHLIAFQRQDGASTGRLEVATGKARGALFLGISSRRIADMAAERPTFVASLGPIAPGGIVPAAGGVLIADDAGHVIGAVGISGDLSDNDEACALHGIVAAGLATPG